MKKKSLTIYFLNFLAVLFLFSTVSAQNDFSVHNLQKGMFGYPYKHYGELIKGDPEAIKLNKVSPKDLNSVVFGYLPYWIYYNKASYKLDYDLLTHIALFDFPISSDGTIYAPPLWPWNDVISEAHSHGVKVLMSVSGFDKDTLHTFLNNQQNIYRCVELVKSVIRYYNLDGVNIDFEWDSKVNPDKKTPLLNFLNSLSDGVKSEFPSAEISFASPPINFNSGFDFNALANTCDHLFIMAYEYYGWWSAITGPVSPLTGDYNNASTLFNKDYATILSKTPNKLILGLPYYGALWKTKSSSENAAVVPDSDYVEPTFYYEFRDNYSDYEKMWSNYYHTSWYRKGSDTSWMQLWIDNDSSLGLKYDLAIAKKIGGIGIWALGYDGNYDDLWTLIRNKFTTTVIQPDISEDIPADFILYDNYPNPFNPSTTIKYSIPKTTQVNFVETGRASSPRITLKIYDVLGREIKILVNEQKSPGTYELKFDAGDLTSGVYFCRMTAGNYSAVIKMLLIR